MGIWLEDGVRIDLTAAAGDFFLTQYRPRIFEDLANTAIAQGSDTDLFTFSGAPGQIQAMSLVFTRKTVEVVLTLDGLEAFRFNIDDLANNQEHALGDSGTFGDFPIRIGSGDTHFIMDLANFPAHFEDSVAVSAQRTTGQGTNANAVLIIWREKVIV